MRERSGHLSYSMARTFFLLALVLSFMLYGLTKKYSMLSMEYLIAPWAVVWLLLAGCKKQIARDWIAMLCVAMGAWYLLTSIRAGGLDERARVRLIVSCASMLILPFFPTGTSKRHLKWEAEALSLLIVIYLLPLMVLALASLFVGRPMHFLWRAENIGIQSEGALSDRLWVLANPNTTVKYAMFSILFSLYLMHNHRQRWIRAALSVAIIVFVIDLIHCQSRTGNIAMGVAIGAIAFRWIMLRCVGWGKRSRFMVGLAAWIVAIPLTVLVFGAVFSFDVRLAASLHPKLESVDVVSDAVEKGALNVLENGRGFIWENGISYLLHHPKEMLLGMGAGEIMGTIDAAYPGMGYFAHLHNSLLETVARAGLPMLAGVLALLVALVKPAVRMFLSTGDESESGAYLFAVLLGIMLVMCLTESYLFVDASLGNILFFYLAGRIMAGNVGKAT